jgi:hypothetical protein
MVDSGRGFFAIGSTKSTFVRELTGVSGGEFGRVGVIGSWHIAIGSSGMGGGRSGWKDSCGYNSEGVTGALPLNGLVGKGLRMLVRSMLEIAAERRWA